MITVNAIGDTCPIPVVKTKKAIEALTQPDTVETLVDNEVAVENLKKMELESRGVKILTCGTCLNYYELSDKLAVGEVTNMYDIAEKMAGASLIVSP